MTDQSSQFALSPEEITRILFTHLLGRQPEASVMQYIPQLMRERGDVSFAIKGVLESDEFKLRNPREAMAMRALSQLQRMPRIVDVGAQTLGAGSHAYNALMEFCPVEVIGFDPLQERLEERLESEGRDNITLLPYALGDGLTHTLYVNNVDATSSLYPLFKEGNDRFPLLAPLETVRTETVDTRRLDAVISHQQVDFLKLDVQGGELLVLQHATEVLKKTAVVQCEVEFTPIYRGQPLFGEIATFLAQHGFYFLDFNFLGHYAHRNDSGFSNNDRLMWADAVFLRESDDSDMRAAQALCATLIYNKLSLAAYLLRQ
ncbi:FkbM family methyltransferase [Rhizobium sp. SL86]|uniref:FkbM family methyltransferase n=1 Tax=Rhizobium sp. SL86 TaxID=2995148 RepID=UPI0022748B44|nr:FkbM family methyltransferase [Rhizobium sp. SL86]MCY1669395.1 FkbM family methyltransferase [Rhizobium sp. SL86]